jgi:hypothetical protein
MCKLTLPPLDVVKQYVMLCPESPSGLMYVKSNRFAVAKNEVTSCRLDVGGVGGWRGRGVRLPPSLTFFPIPPPPSLQLT